MKLQVNLSRNGCAENLGALWAHSGLLQMEGKISTCQTRLGISIYLRIMVWCVLEEKEIQTLAYCYRVSHWSSL